MQGRYQGVIACIGGRCLCVATPCSGQTHQMLPPPPQEDVRVLFIVCSYVEDPSPGVYGEYGPVKCSLTEGAVAPAAAKPKPTAAPKQLSNTAFLNSDQADTHKMGHGTASFPAFCCVRKEVWMGRVFLFCTS